MAMKYVLLTCLSLSKFCALESGIPFFLELSVGPAVVSPPFSWERLIGVEKACGGQFTKRSQNPQQRPFSFTSLPVGDHLDSEADWTAGFRKP